MVSHDGLVLLNVKRRVITAMLAGEVRFANCPAETSFELSRRVFTLIFKLVYTLVLLGNRFVRLRIVRLVLAVLFLYCYFVRRALNTPPFV